LARALLCVKLDAIWIFLAYSSRHVEVKPGEAFLRQVLDANPASRQFVVLLNQLFATRLSPSERPYTLTEVSKATGMSVPYLSLLRKGTIRAVSFQRVAALARFFQVPLDYFCLHFPPVDTMDDLMREALAKPLVREMALRVGKLGIAQRALVLQILEHADQVLQGPAAAPTVPPS